MPNARRGRVRTIGKCFYCQGPVESYAKAYVFEHAKWTDHNDVDQSRTMRRLVHRGYCWESLRTRLGSSAV